MQYTHQPFKDVNANITNTSLNTNIINKTYKSLQTTSTTNTASITLGENAFIISVGALTRGNPLSATNITVASSLTIKPDASSLPYLDITYSQGTFSVTPNTQTVLQYLYTANNSLGIYYAGSTQYITIARPFTPIVAQTNHIIEFKDLTNFSLSSITLTVTYQTP